MTHALGLEDSRTSVIRDFNDTLRTTGLGGQTMMTQGFARLPPAKLHAAIEAIRQFSAFSPDNDPYGEHDCAILVSGDHTVMFKIDYYDRNLRFGSPDPADPAVTTRVITLMLAEDY